MSEHPNDKRRSLVALPERALSRLPVARELLLHGSAEALKGFSEDEVEVLTSLLVRLIENLEEITA